MWEVYAFLLIILKKEKKKTYEKHMLLKKNICFSCAKGFMRLICIN
jgi:hypothetical protein